MLKGLRERKRLTREQLAKRAKTTTAYVSMLESGQRKNPSLGILRRLAKGLGVPVTELMLGHGETETMAGPVGETSDVRAFARELLSDPEYLKRLGDRLRAGKVSKKLKAVLLAHARDPRPTEGRALARRALTDADISYE